MVDLGDVPHPSVVAEGATVARRAEGAEWSTHVASHVPRSLLKLFCGLSCLLFTATAAMHRILAWHASYLHVRGTDTIRYRTGTWYLYPSDGYMYPNICTRVLAVNLEYLI